MSRSAATDTTGLVIERMRKMASCGIGAAASGRNRPSASNNATRPWRASSTTAPGKRRRSMSARSRSR
jgi:hypothetical protein